MTTEHPPVADGVIAIDFDQTLWEWGDLDCMKSKPLPGAVEAVRALKKRGFRIVILTSRLSRTWWRDEAPRYALTMTAFGEWQRTAVERALRRHRVPFDLITAEKVPALHYIDDKAIEFSGDWGSIVERILTEAA